MSFRNVIGQTRAKTILKRMLEGGRLPHALLLCGPAGVGKKALALELAKAVNCAQNGLDPCDQCSSCRRIGAFNYPDLKVLLPATPRMKLEEERALLTEISQDPYQIGPFSQNALISVEKVRELQREVAYGAYEGRWKVAMLLEADSMRAAAGNALLKTLEEPPKDVLIVLTSAKSESLLPTILSRCQRMTLGLIPEGDIRAALVDRRGLPPERATLIARISKGSLSRAYQIAQDDVEGYRREAYRFIEVSLKEDDLEALGLTEEVALQWDREAVERLLEMIGVWFRDVLLFRSGLVEALTHVDRLPDVERLSEIFELARIEQVIGSIDATLDMMSRNVNVQLALLSVSRCIQGA